MQQLSSDALTFLKSVISYYVALNVPKLGKDYIDSLLLKKFRTNDLARLKPNELVDLLNFLLTRSKELFGETVAVADLEKSVRGVVNVTGVNQAYVEFLSILPVGIMENEKITTLARADLEEMVRERTAELEDAKEDLQKKIAERTWQLETERNKLKLVLGNTDDGIFALDKDDKIITFNKIMEEMTGFLESEVINKDVDDFVKIFDKENKPILCRTYCSTFRSIGHGAPGYKAENLILSGNNRQYNIRIVSSAVEETKADVSCIVTIHDITKQKELETMKFDFVSIAAHELRTPLTAIRGYLSILIDELQESEKLTTEQKSYLQKTYLSSNQLYALVENLLSVSRIERGNVRLTYETVEWAALVKETVDNFTDFAKSHNISLTFVPINSSTRVDIDKVMMGEVLSNLLDNAIKYTFSGGSIVVFLEVSDKFVTTHVKDSGQGIPRESLPHLFTKFYRVEGVQEGAHGTGLGLYISKEIVNMHGGEIWVDSIQGKGSTFNFSIPKTHGR